MRGYKKAMAAKAGTQPVYITPDERESRRALQFSLFTHIALVLAVIIKGVVFPGNPVAYIPALRVDVVALPDILKKDLDKISKEPADTAVDEALTRAEKVLEQSPAHEKAKPAPKIDEDEVGLKPKNRATDTKAREKKLKSALDRIKSLERIKEAAEDAKPKQAVIVKGNQLSKGSSLSANAKESAMSSYYDLLRDRLQENWALPVWLARQNLAAKVLVYLDKRGRLLGVKFMKSSGNRQFDDAVSRTIREGNPYPVPPEAIANSLSSNGVLLGFPL